MNFKPNTKIIIMSIYLIVCNLYNKFICLLCISPKLNSYIQIYQNLMTASADKVQFMLQACLEDCLPFVKKGIFTTEELRDMMNQREKHQNSMMKSTFKLSDYLKAIEYQYTVERLRLYRIKTTGEDNVNPLFKKQAKTDFAIIKRILRLWDRTMHKYKYRAYLWKQYMAFCIAIKSKKHFYKALTNALRFLPFQVDLWKIGVRYQAQVGMNMWKARKIFYKGLKMIPAGLKNIELSKEFLKFQIQFVQKLHARQKIIKGEELQQNNMKFIMPQGNDQNQNQADSDNENMMIDEDEQLKNINNFSTGNIKLQEYHEIFYIICTQAIEKNSKITKEIDQIIIEQKLETMKQVKLHQLTIEFIDYLMELFGQNRQDELISQILMKCVEGLKQYKKQLAYEKLIKIQQEKPLLKKPQNTLILQQEQLQVKDNSNKIRSKNLNNSQNVQEWVEEIMQKYSQESIFDQKLFAKAVRAFCLRPNLLQNLLNQLLDMEFQETLKNLIINWNIKLPLQGLKTILQNLLNTKSIQQITLQIQKYLNSQIQKIDVLDYRQNIKLLQKVIEYNKNLNKIEENNKLYRSIMVQGKKYVEFSERAKAMFTQKK